MKTLLLVASALCFLTAPLSASGPEEGSPPPALSQVAVAFVTVNAYGNNLYLDNLQVGNRKTLDAAVVAFTNPEPDSTYPPGSSDVVIAPRVMVLNTGRSNIASSFDVTLVASPGGYSSTKQVASLAKGQAAEVVFDNLTIPRTTEMSLTATSALAGDELAANDTIRQSSVFFPGTRRMVLLEQWTSSTCSPCAANNPTIDAFVAARFDSIAAVKYHVGWPAPGDDPMYGYNPTQSYDRRYYYGVSTVPHVIMDGIVNPSYPYTTGSSLPGAYNPRVGVGTPFALSVTDERIPGDSIRATVTVTVLSPPRAGDYRLRVEAVERHVSYQNPPGSNGETDFFDVFRRSYPSSTGTSVSTAMGQHSYVFTYKLDTAVWVDSLIYTMVFIQNDHTREVMNAAKGRNHAASPRVAAALPGPLSTGRDICRDDAGYAGTPSFRSPLLSTKFFYELFEGGYPPEGWRLVNPDGSITLEGVGGLSGPTFAGSGAVKMDFYSYAATGSRDSLFSGVFTGLQGNDTLKFDWAYAPYTPGTYPDRLIVKLSTDGGATFPHTLFDRSGTSLGTAAARSSAFTPASGEWQTFAVPLAAYLPVPSVFNQEVRERWNVLSLPVAVDEPLPHLVYPHAVSEAFIYTPGSGYGEADSLEVGRACWLKFPAAETVPVSGFPVYWKEVPLAAGWNMLGSVSVPIPVQVISTDPPGILSTPFFGYSPSGYAPADTIASGGGYWVKASESGTLMLALPVHESSPGGHAQAGEDSPPAGTTPRRHNAR
ncbi:MAG: hypothetical protein WB626_02745 [Bacteroidota bacterium]